MTDSHHSGELLNHLEDQLEALAERVETKILQKLKNQQSSPGLFVKPLAASHRPAARGRPRSKYQTQLHIRVLEGDKAWFLQTAHAHDVQSGKFFSHLRALHEQYENSTQTREGE